MQAGGGAAQGGAAGSASALFSAVRRGDLEAVRAQLEKDAKVNSKDRDSRTALMIAACHGHVEVVQALIDAGADVDKQSKRAGTALMFAAQNGHVEVAHALIDEDADVKAQDYKGWSALMYAAGKGHVRVAQALIDAGADVNAQNHHGATALMLAAQNGHVEVVQALIARGADVNAQNHHGATALIIAALHGHVGVVKVLLNASADVDAQNTDGATALIIAAQLGHVDVVRDLLQAGADVNVKCSNTTAMNYASDKPEIIELFQAHKASQAAQAAAAKGQGKAAAGGGVARAGGVAASQPADNPKLFTAVAAEILNKDADEQTDELVQILPSGAQQRLASRLESAFTRQGKGTSADQPSCEIMIPVASRSQLFALAGMPQAMAMPVETQMSLQTLIENTSNNTRGLFELCDKLRLYQSTKFSAQEAEELFKYLGFDTEALYCQSSDGAIAGNQLAELLGYKFIAFCGGKDHTVPQIKRARDSLNQRFAQYAQGKSAAGQITNGGAASQPADNPKLFTAVAAEILNKDADEQTDELVHSLPSSGQKRLASILVSKSGSAFSRPEKETSAEQPSSEIIRPVARRPQEFGWTSMQHAMTWSQPIFGLAGMQPAMAMPVAPQMPLQHLIALAVSNGTGLFGLIELLRDAAPLANFNAHQAAALFTCMGFDPSVFEQANYSPITGWQLADLLGQYIIANCGNVDTTSGLTAEQAARIDGLNKRFALYAQALGI
jgi:ankyrin repeat protein